MYIERHIKKSGSSYVVYIPKSILEQSNLHQNDKVKVVPSSNSITISKMESDKNKK